jgi:hypothetical protein
MDRVAMALAGLNAAGAVDAPGAGDAVEAAAREQEARAFVSLRPRAPGRGRERGAMADPGDMWFLSRDSDPKRSE